MSAPFASAEELREVFDKTFQIAATDEGLGGPLKAADTPQSFFFEDVPLVAHVRPSREGEEGHLVWRWGDAEWEPRVRMTMTAEVANSLFLGNENLTVALATRRVKTGGDPKAALAVLPLTAALFERYRALVEAEYPHLAGGERTQVPIDTSPAEE